MRQCPSRSESLPELTGTTMAPAVRRAHRPMSPRRPSERALIATDQKDDASRAVAPESCPIGRSFVSVPGSTVSTCQSPPTRPLLDPAPHPCRAGAVAWVAIGLSPLRPPSGRRPCHTRRARRPTPTPPIRDIRATWGTRGTPRIPHTPRLPRLLVLLALVLLGRRAHASAPR